MKKLIILLFCILHFTSHAGQIAAGIHSKDLIVWQMWETTGGLKHYLYVYNKTTAEIKLTIKLKRFESHADNSNFEIVPTDKTFSETSLPAEQLTKIPYPEKEMELDFMDFFVANASIGLLNFITDKPDATFINSAYKYYALNFSGPAKAWLRFASIYDPNTTVGITVKLPNATDYYLVKVLDNDLSGEASWGKLHTLQATDASIIKLDNSSAPYTFNLHKSFGTEKIAMLIMNTEYVQVRDIKNGTYKGKEQNVAAVLNFHIPIVKKE